MTTTTPAIRLLTQTHPPQSSLAILSATDRPRTTVRTPTTHILFAIKERARSVSNTQSRLSRYNIYSTALSEFLVNCEIITLIKDWQQLEQQVSPFILVPARLCRRVRDGRGEGRVRPRDPRRGRQRLLRGAPHLLLHPALHRHLPHLHLDGGQAGSGEGIIIVVDYCSCSLLIYLDGNLTIIRHCIIAHNLFNIKVNWEVIATKAITEVCG